MPLNATSKTHQLLAGVSTRDITPRKPLFLVGYPHVPRVSTGTHDPLLASALFLSNGKSSLLFVSVDILFVPRESADFCRSAISRACGVPVSNILISATHSHSAPVTASMLAWRDDPVVPPPDAEFMEQFHAGIIDAAVEACRSAQPAELAVTTTEPITGVGSNRISPDGPFDPEAGIIAIRSGKRLIAASLIYGMHPTVLHEDSTLVSADFPHFARQRLSEAFPGLTTIYHSAPCGNLSPRYHVRAQTFEEAERLGRRLGDFAVNALNKLGGKEFSRVPELGAAQTYAQLVPNTFSTVEQAAAALNAAVETFNRLKREGAPHGPVRTAECVVFGCQEALTLAKAQAAGEVQKLQKSYRKAEVQVFRIGNCSVVGLPGEQFVEYALQVKREAPARTFVVSLANGELQGYIVTPETGRQPSYEAAFALFAPESGRRLVDAAIHLVKDLWA